MTKNWCTRPTKTTRSRSQSWSQQLLHRHQNLIRFQRRTKRDWLHTKSS